MTTKPKPKKLVDPVKAAHDKRFKELSRDPFIQSVIRVIYASIADGMPQGDLRDLHTLAMKVTTSLDEQKLLRNYVPPKKPVEKGMF